MKLTFWRSLTDTAGKEVDWDWSKLTGWLKSPVEFKGQETPGWSAAAFIGSQRRLDRCTLVSALVLDFDDSNGPPDVLTALFRRYLGMAHASKSNTDTNPSYRVVLLLSRPVLPSEYSRLWASVTRSFTERVDHAAKDCSRFWFVPCRTAETKFDTIDFTGSEIDVDAVLEEEDKRDALIRKTIEAARLERRQSGGTSVAERASRYVAKMDPSISGSRGHDALWAATLALVKGFSLPRHEAEAILTGEFNQRCQPPWSAKEIAHKLDNAASAKLADGYLIGEQNWRRDEPIPPCPPPPEPPATFGEPGDESGFVEEDPNLEEPKTASERFGVVSIQQLCLDVLSDVNKPREKNACRSGVTEIDEAIGGFRSGMVTVFGASTNFGKTTFSIMSADLAAKAGKTVLYCTLEDSPLLYGRRIVARRGRVNATRLRDGCITHDERKRLLSVTNDAEREPFLLDCIGKSVEWISRAIEDLSRERHIDLVVVDYIQRARTERRTQDRRNEITLATEMLTNTIKRVRASGLLLSQIRRLEQGERPTKEHLKESGDIENMAEHILLGYSDFEPGTPPRIVRKIYLDKNKDGPVVSTPIELPFDEVSANFIESELADTAPEFRDTRDDLNSVFGDYDQ